MHLTPNLVTRLAQAGSLRPGDPVAPESDRLGLLPSGPDPVHRLPPHRTQPSTLPGCPHPEPVLADSKREKIFNPVPVPVYRLHADYNKSGEGGIRTLEAFTPTRFPIARTRPAMRPLQTLNIKRFSGEGGIRTHGGPKSTTVFETAPFNRSGTSPTRSLMVSR